MEHGVYVLVNDSMPGLVKRLYPKLSKRIISQHQA